MKSKWLKNLIFILVVTNFQLNNKFDSGKTLKQWIILKMDFDLNQFIKMI